MAHVAKSGVSRSSQCLLHEYGKLATRGERDRFRGFCCVPLPFSRQFSTEAPPFSIGDFGLQGSTRRLAMQRTPCKYSMRSFSHNCSAWLPCSMHSSSTAVFVTCDVPAEMCQRGQFPPGGKTVPTFPPIAVSNSRLFSRENSPQEDEILKRVSTVALSVLLATLLFLVVLDLLSEMDA